MLLVIIPGLSFAVLKPVRKGPGRMMRRAVPERRPFPANGQQQPVSLRK